MVVCSLTMKHTRVVLTKCTPGFACRAFSDITLVCFIVNDYNMVCSALFLQRALYTVHCTNIMHSRKLSFVITPAVFN